MNRGGINLKTIIVIVILLLVGVLGVLGVSTVKTYLGGAAAGADPKGVLATPGSDGKTATVTWSTDKAVQAVVLYGTSPAALLLSAPETDSSTDHSVVLSPLRPGQNYYFQIEVADQMFENGGIPWSFKTSGSSEVPTATPTIVPTTVPTVPIVSGTACNRTTDYNSDGAINTFDYIYCMKNGGTAGAASSGASLTSSCDNVDYDGNGVINSLDRIKCLQNKK
jgi:Purple acid Phosphatase, N-terminal domain